MAAPKLGDRIRSVRKRRGLSQRELALLSGISLSLIRKLEQGEREDTRLETLRRLARVLEVSTSALIVRPEPTDDSADHWDHVRDALLRKNDQPGEPSTLGDVLRVVEAAERLFTKSQYNDLGVVLPSLLRDADALGTEGRKVRSRVLHLAGLSLVSTRQFDAAEIALRRALDDAPEKLEKAAIINSRCWLLMRKGDLAGTLDLASQWADDIEPRITRATREELTAWGGLLLRVSTAASRNNEPGQAADALRFAQAAAVTLTQDWAPPSDPLRTFGPIAVATRRAENFMIEDRPDQVLRIAERIPRSGVRATDSSRNRHRLDVARAYVQLRRYSDAFEVLQDLRAVGSEWIVHQRMARDILGHIVSKRRTLTPEMREMTGFIHLEC